MMISWRTSSVVTATVLLVGVCPENRIPSPGIPPAPGGVTPRGPARSPPTPPPGVPPAGAAAGSTRDAGRRGAPVARTSSTPGRPSRTTRRPPSSVSPAAAGGDGAQAGGPAGGVGELADVRRADRGPAEGDQLDPADGRHGAVHERAEAGRDHGGEHRGRRPAAASAGRAGRHVVAVWRSSRPRWPRAAASAGRASAARGPRPRGPRSTAPRPPAGPPGSGARPARRGSRPGRRGPPRPRGSAAAAARARAARASSGRPASRSASAATSSAGPLGCRTSLIGPPSRRCPSSSASRARPRAQRLFTVPGGTPRIAATSVTG